MAKKSKATKGPTDKVSAGDGDKRKVSTDALETLGTIITSQERRDAIHLAVEPVRAKQRLEAGQHVNAKGGTTGTLVGIVDPFLDDPVYPGEWFWLVVYPRQIHSLRHVWTHPEFAAPEVSELENWVEQASGADVEKAKAWLEEFCGSNGPGYDEVIEAALDESNWDSEYLHFRGRDAHGEIPPEFYLHLETVTGVRVPGAMRASFFSCSC